MFRTTGWISKTIVFGVLLFSGTAEAQTSAKAQLAQELIPLLKDIPGISALPVGNVNTHGGVYTSADVTLRSKKMTVVGFKKNGIQMGAVVPSSFKLTDVLPIPNGTPIDGVSFPHVAVVYLPKGHNKQTFNVSGLPFPVRNALTGQTSVTLNVGLNLLGEADFSSSGTVKQVLSAVGLSNFSLPLNGTFPTDLFKHDPKTASAQLKDRLLDNLHLNLTLPQLRIPGMPSAVSVKKGAQFSVVAKKLKNSTKREYFAGVNGDLTVKMGAKTVDFDFYVLAEKPGAGSNKITLKGDTGKNKTTVKVSSLTLKELSLLAVKDGGKWDVSVDATSELKNKDVDVSASVPASGNSQITIKTQMTLAELTSLNVPGLTDVQLDEIIYEKDKLQATAEIKKMEVDIATFKKNGHTYIAVATPKSIHISDLIPQIGKTPLDDVSFDHMSYVWAPQGGALSNLKATDLPDNVSGVVAETKTSFDVKAGLNVIGQLGIERNGDLGKMLAAVGAYKSSLPLVGKLSLSVFKKTTAGATQIKNDILDNLDINLPVNVDIKGMPHGVNIQNANLEIKGVKDQGRRALDVDVAGRLDVTAGSSKADFDFEVNLVQKDGKSTVQFDAQEVKGTKFSVDMVEKFEFTNMSFHMDNSGGKGWNAFIKADTKLKNTALKVWYNTATASQPRHINIDATGLTIGKLLGVQGLPGLDDIKLMSAQIYPGNWLFYANVKGINSYIAAEKTKSGTGHFVAVGFETFSPAQFIPGAGSSHLKDVKFEGLTMVYSPLKSPTALDQSGLDASAAAWIKKTNANPVLKQGMNVFGHIDVEGADHLKSLLSQVGVKNLKMPLKGVVSKKSLAGNTAALKNEILDNLDINVPLDFSIPGLPGAVNIQNANLEIKGVNDNGKRDIDVDVVGVLDFTHESKKVDFDFDAELVRHKGQNKIQIDATEKKGETIKVDFVKSFTLKNLSVHIDNFNQDGWDGYVKADSTIDNKSVDVQFYPKDKVIDITTDGLTLAELIDSPGLPGLDDVALDSIKVQAHQMLMAGTFKGQKGALYVQNSPYGQGHYIAAYLYDLNLASLIPGASSTPLNDVDFTNLVLFYNPVGRDLTWNEMHISGDAGPWILQSNSGATFKAGMNVFGYMHVKTGGKMKTLLNDVGVKEVKLPLNGGFSPKAFSKNISGQAIKNAILDNLDIKVNLPKLNIPGLDDYVTFSNEHLTIKGKLPDGKTGLSVKVAADSEIKLKGEDLAFDVEIDYDSSPGAARTDMEIKGSTDKPWNTPFGISFLDLDSLTLDIKKQKSGTDRTYNVDVGATAKIGQHSNLTVDVDVTETNGQVSDVYFKLDGPLSLADIPDVNKVPHADKFTLNTLIISEHGVEADSTFNDKPTDFYAFHGSGWNVAVTQQNFNLGELIPTPGNLLKEIKFPYAAVMLSESGLNKPYNELSKVGQDALSNIFSSTDDIDIKPGLAFAAGFHPDHAGSLGSHLKGVGVHSGVVIMGEIGGIFGGTPSVTLAGELSSAGATKKLPSFMSFVKSEQLDFFVSATEQEFDIGIEVDLNTVIEGDHLTFDTKIAVKDVEAGELGIEISGGMQGTWHKPFGIPGLSIGNLTIASTIDTEGLELGYAGTTTIAGDKISVAADVQFSEALIPDGAAFKGTADQVDMFFLEQVATDMLGKAFKFDIPQGIFPTFKKVDFAFVSPGAQDKALGLNGTGFGLGGQLAWMGHDDLGKIQLSIAPTKGIYAAGDIANMDLGPLKLKNNNFLLKAGLTSLPLLKAHGDIDLLGLTDTVDIVFDKSGASIKSTISDGPSLNGSLDLTLAGIKFHDAKPDFKNTDFSMDGSLHLDVEKFITGPAKTALNDIFNDLDTDFKSAEKTLKKAQADVASWTKQINAERAKVRKERAKAEKRLHEAEDRVNSLNKKISDDWKAYHHCHGWFTKWFCKAAKLFEIGILKGAIVGADEALKLAETMVAHFPIDLDPRVAYLITKRDFAKGALKLAEDAVDGADDLDQDVIKGATDALVDAIGKNARIVIKKAEFQGDLTQFFGHNGKVLLTLDISLWGDDVGGTYVFSITSLGDDVEHLTLTGLYALEHLVDKELTKLPGALKHKIIGALAKKMDAALTKNIAAVKKFDASLPGYSASDTAMQTKMNNYNEAAVVEQFSSPHSPLDTDVSESFTDELIEVGHTGLCLNAYKGSVYMQPCNGAAPQKWSTQPISGAKHVTPNSGYVRIIEKSSGKCIVPEGSWKQVTKPIVPTDADSSTYTTYEFQGDGKLNVTDCKNLKEFYWKVLQHGTALKDGGDGWMLMANLAANQCLHFTHPSAKPGASVAEWKPCVGSANQVYRVADSATPKYYPDYISIRNDQLGLCVGEANKDGTVPMATCDKAAYYDYMVDVRGYAKFINTNTGKCLQPGGYDVGAQMTEVPCTQLDYQWWDADPQAGGIIIKNAQTELCTNPPFNWAEVPPTQVDCASRNNAVFAPVSAKYRYTGPNWVVTTPETIPPANKRYKTKGGHNLCAFEHLGSFVPGVVYNNNGKEVCATAFHASIVPEAMSTGKFRLMSAAPDGVWLPNTDKNLSKYNLPTGGFGGAEPANIYTCRIKEHHFTQHFGPGGTDSGTMPETIGWTADGKTCHVFNFMFLPVPVPPAKDFDILSRWDKAFYQLQGSASEQIVQPTNVPTAPFPPAVKTAPVWMVGTDYAPYAWDAKQYNWVKQKGCLKQITVNDDGVPFGIHCNDFVVQWDGTNWNAVGGVALKAQDIGISGQLYAIDMDGNPRQWIGKWVPHPTCAKRIDVNYGGTPVIIGCDGEAKYFEDPNWLPMNGWKGKDITSGMATWMVDENGKAYEWSGGVDWINHGGCLERIDVDAGGSRPWGLGCDGAIHAYNGSAWIKMPGKAYDIGLQWKSASSPRSASPLFPPVVNTAPVWIVGYGNVPYAWDAQKYDWVRQKGCLKQIAVAHNGIPVGIQCDDYAVTWSGGNWLHLGNKKGRDIGSGPTGDTWMIDQAGAAWKWTANGWQVTPGCLKRIGVDSQPKPVALGCDDKAYYLSGKTWEPLGDMKGKDISTGNAAWMVGEDGIAYEWGGSGEWQKHVGDRCMARIGVDADGNPWAVGCDGGVYARDGSGWKKMPGGGVLDIGLQPSKS